MLEREKNFLELWSKVFPRLSKNKFNLFFSFSGLAAGVAPILFGNIPSFVEEWSELASLLLQVFSGLLGFIIAGYTIFVTSANPTFIVAFWRYVEPKTQMPLLKLHLVVYMRLFLSIFLSAIFFGSLVMAFKLWPLIRTEIQFTPRFSQVLQAVVVGIAGWRVTEGAVQIKAMIFNLYDLTITQAQYLDKVTPRPAVESGSCSKLTDLS